MSDLRREELISAYVDGELTAHEQRRVEQLLADDAQAKALYEQFLAQRHALQSLPRTRAPVDLSAEVVRRIEQLRSSAGPNVGAVLREDRRPVASNAQAGADGAVERAGAGGSAVSPRAAGSKSPNRRMFLWPLAAVAATIFLMVMAGAPWLQEQHPSSPSVSMHDKEKAAAGQAEPSQDRLAAPHAEESAEFRAADKEMAFAEPSTRGDDASLPAREPSAPRAPAQSPKRLREAQADEAEDAAALAQARRLGRPRPAAAEAAEGGAKSAESARSAKSRDRGTPADSDVHGAPSNGVARARELAVYWKAFQQRGGNEKKDKQLAGGKDPLGQDALLVVTIQADEQAVAFQALRQALAAQQVRWLPSPTFASGGEAKHDAKKAGSLGPGETDPAAPKPASAARAPGAGFGGGSGQVVGDVATDARGKSEQAVLVEASPGQIRLLLASIASPQSGLSVGSWRSVHSSAELVEYQDQLPVGRAGRLESATVLRKNQPAAEARRNVQPEADSAGPSPAKEAGPQREKPSVASAAGARRKSEAEQSAQPDAKEKAKGLALKQFSAEQAPQDDLQEKRNAADMTNATKAKQADSATDGVAVSVPWPPASLAPDSEEGTQQAGQKTRSRRPEDLSQSRDEQADRKPDLANRKPVPADDGLEANSLLSGLQGQGGQAANLAADKRQARLADDLRPVRVLLLVRPAPPKSADKPASAAAEAQAPAEPPPRKD